MELDWIKCREGQGAHWCNLRILNLNAIGETTYGVYVIWYEGNPGKWVRVGQGLIAERLQAHRSNKRIVEIARNSPLRATWAMLPQCHCDGVERFLGETLHPLIGDRFPDVPAVKVNLPA